MKKIIFKYSIMLLMALIAFKSLEYTFFSYRITLDLYLGVVAVSFLCIGLISYRYYQKHFHHSVTKQVDPALLNRFSPRELEVLQLLTKGYSNKELAKLLNISPNTVKTHLNRLYEKLGVNNRTQAVSEANLLNLLD